MLDNNYLNLYDTDFYKMRMYFLSGDEVQKFQMLFAYVNVLYVECKKCIEILNNEIVITNESKIIYAILESKPEIFNVLKEVRDVDNITYTKGKKTYLQAAVMVCEEHLKNINKNIFK